MRSGTLSGAVVAAVMANATAPVYAGLINPTSTVDEH